ncbi:hypothetical protein MXB_505 [Myxobolus squamalis]|nr:hypothetical protein MXB_505 [Myxobolus squamalis]
MYRSRDDITKIPPRKKSPLINSSFPSSSGPTAMSLICLSVNADFTVYLRNSDFPMTVNGKNIRINQIFKFDSIYCVIGELNAVVHQNIILPH